MNLDGFRGKKILVVGDVMLDEYIFGDVLRLSPEAPIPILKHQTTKTTFGGAANAAYNLATMDGDVYLAGVIGTDKDAKKFTYLLSDNGIRNLTIQDPTRPTIIKQRVLARYMGHPYQQVVRIDREETKELSRKLERIALDKINSVIHEVDAVIFSEYDKGYLTHNLVDNIKELAKEKTIIANAKPSKIDLYKGVDWIILNTSETESTTGQKYDERSIKNIGRIFIERYNPSYFLMTAGAEGMFLYDKNGYNHIKTTAREVSDVSGAGDTVAAALSLALSSGFNPIDAVSIANCAAGVVVEKLGTSTVSLEELTEALTRNT